MTLRDLVVSALAIQALLASASDAGAQDRGASVTLASSFYAAGTLEPGQQSDTRSFTVDAATGLSFTVISANRLDVEVITPDGTHLTSKTASAAGAWFLELHVDDPSIMPFPGVGKGEHTIVMLESPQPGRYEMRLDAGSPVNGRTLFAITLSLVSDLQVGVIVPQRETLVGLPVAINAFAYERTSPVVGALVKASITEEARQGDPLPDPRTLALLDDGLGADTTAGDGIYTGVFLPSAAGRHAVVVHFEGKTSAGLPYERHATTAFMASERTSTLSGSYSATAMDDDGNGLFERLHVGVGVNIASAGRFNLETTLRAPNGRVVSSNSVVGVDAGAQALGVDFTSADVRSLGTDGPFTVSSVELQELTPSQSVLRDTATDPATTPPFRLVDFERGPIELTGSTSIVGVDDDKDGFVDRLRVLVGVDLLLGASYEWSAQIVDRHGTELGVAKNQATLDAGERMIDLVFDGCQIGAKGLEGPYVVQQLIVSGGGNSLGPLPALTPVDLDLSQFSCRLETTPPETTCALSPPAAAQSWNRTSVVVTLTADDGPGGAGVREIHESFTGAQSSSAIDPGSHVGVAITAEGTTALSYFAVDNAGNAESPHTLLIKIDKTAPVIECPANVSLMYLVTPSMIGLAKATDGLDPAPVVTNDSPQLFGIGTTIVTWTATDVAGNTSTCQQAVTVLDLPQGAYDHLKRR